MRRAVAAVFDGLPQENRAFFVGFFVGFWVPKAGVFMGFWFSREGFIGGVLKS